MRERRFSEAFDSLQIVIRTNPDDSAALLNRAIVRVFLNKPEVSYENFADFISFTLILKEPNLLVLTHLFVKVPRPGDSEGTFSVFELPPVTTVPV